MPSAIPQRLIARLSAAITGAFLAGVSSLACAAIPAIDDVPLCIATMRADLVAQHDSLVSARSALQARIGQHNASCNSVDEGSTEAAVCAGDRDALRPTIVAHGADTAIFNESVHKAVAGIPASRHVAPAEFRRSGNALIGGTTWIAGYNVQKSDPRIEAKAHEMLAQQMKLADLDYADAVDFKRYNFVLGIAASTNAVADLACRVVFDELSNGQFTAQEQQTYNLMKDRRFDELACHSNGAMICLAALTNRDVKAERVTLYGPQLTREGLRMWNDMVQSGRLKSVQIYANENDPVPPFSIALDRILKGRLSDLSTSLLRPQGLAKYVKDNAPNVTVTTFGCGAKTPAIACHSMAVYRAKVSCSSQSSTATVPGTALHGRSLAEPPVPCDATGH